MPRRMPARDLALVAVFAALLAALSVAGAVPVPGLAAPITLQTFGVMLAGAVLGARRGALAVLVFLALVAAGLPLLPGGRGGLSVFAGPTAGFLLGWPLGALVVGAVLRWRAVRGARRGRAPQSARAAFWWTLLACVLGGIVVVYAVGVPVLAARTATSGLLATAVSSLVFLPGDLVKAALAASIAVAVRRGYPVLDPDQDATAPRDAVGRR